MTKRNNKQVLKHIYERTNKYCLLLSGFIIVFLSVVVSNGVIMRYFIGRPEPYSYEISGMLLIVCIMLAIPEVQRRDKHIKASFLIVNLSQSLQDFLQKIFAPVLALTYVVVIIWQSWKAGWYAYEVGELTHSVLRWPIYPIKLLIPICFCLLCLVLIVQLGEGIYSLKETIIKIKYNKHSKSQ